MKRKPNITVTLTELERVVVQSILGGHLPDESDPQSAKAISRVIDKLRLAALITTDSEEA